MLVVGVGTGLELESLAARRLSRVTGVDISAAMLDIARERVVRKGLRQVKGLHVMDAGAMDFADGQFDVALAPYVMSVVPNPARVLERDVARRAARRPDDRDEPFRRRGRPARRGRSGDGKLAWWLGWHPKFAYAAIGDWIAAQPDAELIERREAGAAAGCSPCW